MSYSYSPSSFNSQAVNMARYYKKHQCSKGHHNISLIEEMGRRNHWVCNICGDKFWTEEFKRPTSIARG